MTHMTTSTPLDLDTFIDHLEELAEAFDSLDYLGAHGFLTALVVGSNTSYTSEEELDPWFDKILGLSEETSEIPDNIQIDRLKSSLIHLYNDIEKQLEINTVDKFELPCDYDTDTEEYTDIQAWCCGFVECAMINEEAWFHNEEQKTAELVLPILVVSELVEDPEIEQLYSDERMLSQSAQMIPDVIAELYLLFHSKDY